MTDTEIKTLKRAIQLLEENDEDEGNSEDVDAAAALIRGMLNGSPSIELLALLTRVAQNAEHEVINSFEGGCYAGVRQAILLIEPKFDTSVHDKLAGI